MNFTELIDKLKSKPYFEDIGIHIIKGNFLYPFWKRNTDITVEEWKKFHEDRKMRIDEDKYLSEMILYRKPIFVERVKENDPNCLLKFGIKSTNLIPIEDNETIIGFVTMPIFSKYYTYSEKDKNEIIEIVKDNENYIKEMILCIEQ
ncbi:hypothetical protein R0131_17045 [Clostridium sp. AL.422]|uniref:hypothetical protein n=1 Tax=Clostridium TaxID=1485 RepID=UPI00293DFC3E|nr:MULTISPECIES: hypothetical protein [unclassified Clostridium]MDV4152537.1 hypothetical protein [Clostridium sp. AL.422]